MKCCRIFVILVIFSAEIRYKIRMERDRSKMKVNAVVTQQGKAPVYKEIEVEEPKHDEVAIEVKAVGYSNLVKMRASGAHYSSGSTQGESLVGVDGVGKVKGTDQLVYFVNFGPGKGTYLEIVNVPKQNVFPFPKDADDKAVDRVAALANGTMATLIALGDRVKDVPTDAKIAIVGVTGTAGQLAIQLAKTVYGAKTVVGIARSAEKLEKLKLSQPLLDDIITLDEDDDKVIASKALDGVDIVLDFLWGKPASKILANAVGSRSDKTRQLSWVQIGLIAGDDFTVPSSFLRSSNLVILGSGIGPLDFSLFQKSLQSVTDVLASGKVNIDYREVALKDAGEEWAKPLGDVRTYFKV